MGSRHRNRIRRQGGLQGAAGVLAGRAIQQARKVERNMARTRDEELDAIADQVYHVARDVRESGGVGIPLAIYAPIRAGFELATQGIVRAYGLAARFGVSEEEAREDVADYLVAWFVELTATFNVEHFARWRERVREREGEHGHTDDAADDGAELGDGDRLPDGGPEARASEREPDAPERDPR